MFYLPTAINHLNTATGGKLPSLKPEAAKPTNIHFWKIDCWKSTRLDGGTQQTTYAAHCFWAH